MRGKGKKEVQSPELERDDFQAYGEYSYAYLHENDPDRDEGEPRGERPAPDPEALKRARNRRRTGGFFKLLVMLTALTVFLIVLMETVFRLETVYVIGNQEHTPQQVVSASGLTKGVNIFSIRQEDVARSMEKDHTLILKDMQLEYPHTVYLYVEERHVAAAVRWLGNLYELDKNGMVMSESSDIALPADMPLITGLSIVSARVGQYLSIRSQKQTLVYQELMEELELQLCRNQVTEINLFTTDNYYLITKEGVTVRLGDGQYLRAKVGAFRTYMPYLRSLDKSSGMLDVSIPEDAKFLPDIE